MDPTGLGQKKPGPCALRWTPGHEEPKRQSAAIPHDPKHFYTRVFNKLDHGWWLGKWLVAFLRHEEPSVASSN